MSTIIVLPVQWLLDEWPVRDNPVQRAMMDFDQIDTALACGHVTERDWYARVRDLLERSYLATDDPQQQSGLGGDAAHWERRRRVIVEDALLESLAH